MSSVPFISVVGDLGTPVISPNLDGNSVAAAPYTEYSISVYYTDRTGKIMLPVCGPPGTPAQFLDYEAPTQKKLVLWIATRLGAWPVLPDPTPQNANEVYLDGKTWETAPMFLPGSTQYSFSVGGYYEYGLYVPLPLKQVFQNFARVPFDTSTTQGVDSATFKKIFQS